MKLSIKRLMAYWIDFVILATVLIGCQWLLYFVTGGFPFNYLNNGYKIEAWVLLTMSLPVWLYFISYEFVRSQTIGKKLFKIKVTNNNGQKISIKQAVLRTLVKIFPWELTHIIILIPQPWWEVEIPRYSSLIYIPNGLIVLYITFLFWKKGLKAIHDYCAQTLVIKQ